MDPGGEFRSKEREREGVNLNPWQVLAIEFLLATVRG